MPTSRPEIAGVVDDFIRQHFRIADGDPAFSREAHLFEGGYVDSAGVVELLMFLESTFGVTLDDRHIFSDDFTSINGITAILASLDGVYDGRRAAVRRA
jgi:acyl carrier protein